MRLPSGCFTVDGSCKVVASTLPHTFSPETVRKLAHAAVSTFQAAREAQVVLTEIQIQYPALKVTARELRGGAMIFLAPQTVG